MIISSAWNITFYLFDLPYSRATVLPFLIALAILFVFKVITDKVRLSSEAKQFTMLLYCAYLLIMGYYYSGYSESWSFLLLLPLIAGIYGERKILIYYSVIGMFILTYLSINYPLNTYQPDGIDISNRLLVYIILATLSFIVLITLQMIYSRQVKMVVEMMEKTVEEVVSSFVISVEAKDDYTFGHSKRVSEYAVALAKNLTEYGEEDLKRLKWSGLVHDIGKINISESILMKSGKLTDDEMEIIKTHPVIGARMVERIERLQPLKNGVLYHHERWDGKGYPSKRKGTDIPMDARILSIADAFDAMTSTRSYRSQMSLEEAFKRLNDGKGSQFDPELIELLNHKGKSAFIKINEESNDELQEFETLTDLL